MGQGHNELRRGEFSRAIKALVGDSDSESGLERFGETLQPIIDLWNLPEMHLLRGERLFGCVATTAVAPAGRSAALRIVYSGVEDHAFILEAIATDQEVEIGLMTPDPGPLANTVSESAYPFDARNFRKPAVIIQSGDATLAGFMQRPSWRTLTIPVFGRPYISFVLTRGISGAGGLPSRGLYILTTALAVSLKIGLVFRERQLTQGEQTAT